MFCFVPSQKLPSMNKLCLFNRPIFTSHHLEGSKQQEHLPRLPPSEARPTEPRTTFHKIVFASLKGYFPEVSALFSFGDDCYQPWKSLPRLLKGNALSQHLVFKATVQDSLSTCNPRAALRSSASFCIVGSFLYYYEFRHFSEVLFE